MIVTGQPCKVVPQFLCCLSCWRRPQAKLEQTLKDRGWTVRRIKVDGGCWEVYGLDEKGQRVEAYFHPLTLAPVPTKAK